MKTRFLGAAALALAALPAHAGNVTNQQLCQVMADHVVMVLEAKDWDDADDEIAAIQALSDAQKTVIAAEVEDSATQLSMPVAQVQQMVDQQETQFRGMLAKKYGEDALYSDFAVSLAKCADDFPKAMGSDPETLGAALTQIVAWAKDKR